MSETPEDALGRLLSLIVHDLRNPAATIKANVEFLRSAAVTSSDPDLDDALGDSEIALRDLELGLEQLGWIARWLAGEAPAQIADGDVAAALAAVQRKVRELEIDVEAQPPLAARGGGNVVRIVEALLANSARHARGGRVTLRARREADEVLVEVCDSGSALAAELREVAFTVEGQEQLKGRPDGRYGRTAGLLAARVLTESIGGRIEADGQDGAAIFRLRLKSL